MYESDLLRMNSSCRFSSRQESCSMPLTMFHVKCYYVVISCFYSFECMHKKFTLFESLHCLMQVLFWENNSQRRKRHKVYHYTSNTKNNFVFLTFHVDIISNLENSFNNCIKKFLPMFINYLYFICFIFVIYAYYLSNILHI